MSQSPSRRRRTARPLGVLLAGAVATAALVVLPEPAYAVSNSFQFSHNRDQHASFGANGVVMIDGTLAHQDHCVGLDNLPTASATSCGRRAASTSSRTTPCGWGRTSRTPAAATRT